MHLKQASSLSKERGAPQKFGKIIGKVRSDFDSEAIFDITNWGFSEKEAEVPFSFLSTSAAPTSEEKLIF